MKSQKMFIIVFGFFIIKLQISASEPQFPPHNDFQKVGEAIFNNEKFNILKPTIHRVTDHFKDFMLRTESSYHPAKRIFIDDNGFRHDWSGFGEKTESLRKTDLKHVSGSFENASDNIPETDIIATNGNDNVIATVERTNISDNNVSSNDNENNDQEVVNNASDNDDTVQNLTEEDTETLKSKKATTPFNLFPAIQKKKSSTKITIDKRLRQGKANQAASAKPAPAKSAPAKSTPVKPAPAKSAPAKPAPAKPAPAKSSPAKSSPAKPTPAKPAPAKSGPAKPALAKPASAEPAPAKSAPAKTSDTDKTKPKVEAERTVATTTFFCPYFGTITMSAFID